MSQNGNVLSLADRANSINDWVQKIFSEEIWGYIKLSREDLSKLNSFECGEIAFILRQQAFFVQSKINKISACIKSLEHDIAYLIAPSLDSYDKYKKYEEKRFLAIRENEVLRKLDTSLIDLSQKKEALEFLAQRLNDMSISISDLRRMKYESGNTGTT